MVGIRLGRGRLMLALFVLMIGSATVALAGLSALRAANAIETARGTLALAREAGAGSEELLRATASSRDQLKDAERELSSPAARVVAAVPLVGRSLRAEQAVVDAASAAVAGVAVVAEHAPTLRGPAGGVDTASLTRLAEDLRPVSAQAEAALRSLSSVRTGFTPPQVSRGVRDAESALAPVIDGLSQGASAAPSVAGLLGADGPRQVLVALQNNAELRGTGGYVSTFATGVLQDGTVTLTPFRDVIEVVDPPELARPVPAPPEFVEDYAEFLADTTLWRNWTMSPDIPASASVGAEAAGALLGTKPDVVILLDVPAMAAIISLSGEQLVLDDGTELSGEGLTDALLVDSYARAGVAPADQDARRAALRRAATEAVTSLLGDDVPPLQAARLLGDLTRGRHLAVWSARPEQQAALVELGVAGAVDADGGDLVMVSANTLNANKLDYYVQRRVAVDATVGRDSARVVQRVELTNTAPEDLVPYVAGLVEPGTVVQRVEMSISPQATVRSFTTDGSPTVGGIRTDARRTRAFTYVRIERGQSIALELRYDVPVDSSGYRLTMLPQPLAKDAELGVTVQPAERERLGEVTGASVVNGVIDTTSPWRERRVLDVALDEGSWSTDAWARVQEFWNSPVAPAAD